MVTIVTGVTIVTKCSYTKIIMTHFKQPYLQPYKGKATRHTCPECNTKNSFTLYLNGDTHQPINPKVGICNRLIKCAYHYTPKQYYQDNLHLVETSHTSPHTTSNGTSNGTSHVISKKSFHQPKESVAGLPFPLVEKSASYQSNFVRFLCEFMTEEQIRSIGNNYALGASKNKEVIFWQIDKTSKVRTGKIMQYNPETGKRIKHNSGAIDWVHNKLKKLKQLPENFNLQQCFFGEHLLKIYPDKTVAIVESEKTACIASVAFPELNWISSGNLQGISVEKCKVLKGKNVILFPDLKAFEIWKQKAVEIQKQCKCNIKVSNFLENFATITEKEQGLDIADFLIENLKNKNREYHSQPPLPTPTQNQNSETLNNFIAFNPAVQILINKLNLEEVKEN